MIHILRWVAIFATPMFFYWVYKPTPHIYRKRNRYTFN